MVKGRDVAFNCGQLRYQSPSPVEATQTERRPERQPEGR
jgi:hypothetical protein